MGAAPGRTDAGPRKFSFPNGWTELVPELELHPDDDLVTKQRVGAFIGTSLDDPLRQRGVTQVLLAGIAASAGVEATARSAQRSRLQCRPARGCDDGPRCGCAPS